MFRPPTLSLLRRLLLIPLLLVALPASADDERLDVVAPWEINSLDPVQAGLVFGRMQVAETLVDSDDTGTLVPGLATRWQSPDAIHWHLTLREGVHFHDGTPMTPESVAASLERTLERPGVLAQADIVKVTPTDHGVDLVLSRPFAALPALLSHYSTQILAPAAYDDDGQVTRLIATGPYQVTRLALPQRLDSERFDSYWGKAPAIATASYLAAPRSETRTLMAQSGDADLVFTLDPVSQARLRMTPGLDLLAEPVPRTVVLKLDATHPGLDTPALRHAISLGIDRDGIAQGILRRRDAAAHQLLPASMARWHVSDRPAEARNLDKARKLLASEGWTPGPDGILTRDGSRLALTLTTFADRPELPVIATALQAQLRELGVEVQVNVGNASEIPAGHQDGSLNMALLGRNYGLVPNPLPTLMQDFGPTGGDWGAMNWSSPALQAIFTELTQSTDPARHDALAQQAATLLADERPVIPVVSYVQTLAANARLEGVSLDPFERSYRLSDMRWED